MSWRGRDELNHHRVQVRTKKHNGDLSLPNSLPSVLACSVCLCLPGSRQAL